MNELFRDLDNHHKRLVRNKRLVKKVLVYGTCVCLFAWLVLTLIFWVV